MLHYTRGEAIFPRISLVSHIFNVPVKLAQRLIEHRIVRNTP